MDNLDGRAINDLERFRHWKCDHGHIMGVTERVKVTMEVVKGGATLKYFTTRLLIFRQAVDLTVDVPTEIEVAGSLDGKILSMVWRCSVCNAVKEWHPEKTVVTFLASTYLAE